MNIFESWRSGARNLACFNANESSRARKGNRPPGLTFSNERATKRRASIVVGAQETRPHHLARRKQTNFACDVARRKYRGCLCAARPMNHSAYRKFAQKVARGVCMASHDQRIAQRKIAQKFARGVCMASHDQRNILRNESTRSVYGWIWRNVSSFGGALWNPWTMMYQFAWFT